MVVRQSTSFVATGVALEADVVVPDPAHGVVVFAHGSGSGRHSPRNRHVAAELQRAGLATVLMDLLTPEEETADTLVAPRFDIGLLASRLVSVTDRMATCESLTGLGIGLFGGSTGAGAALVAAAERPGAVRAVVSRGGRPDLAGEHLTRVRQPTLLIVGERDPVVIDLNRAALACLPPDSRIALVPGAAHLFEEPGALDRVAALTRTWFTRHLSRDDA
ncbi:dienelactone hydrolase family protein [Sphaerisporangium aureirubrum]|uniref:Dienelactone hydrolase family protein n=1 Tax=Sphaerisporangium aureirubrum TaxID=1544736 RepID=A0ABW1NN08_9ACTN